MCFVSFVSVFIFFNDTATTEIYTLSLHDALPIFDGRVLWANLHLLFWLSLTPFVTAWMGQNHFASLPVAKQNRSEEHTSELQSHSDLVCRLLLEKKKDDAQSRLLGDHMRTVGRHC